MDPIWQLFNYACDKFYYVEYGSPRWPKIIRGLLLNCGGTKYSFITEQGLCIISYKEINIMHPIPMPKNLCNNFRKTIEIYLKERAELNE